MKQRSLCDKDETYAQLRRKATIGLSWSVIAIFSILLFNLGSLYFKARSPFLFSADSGQIPPLMMKGGDPYLRALMRTITASESNVSQPYYVLYGGQYVTDLKQHPNRCIPIVRGPNIGNCSTAAGRYQFINTTWDEKARHYHPRPPRLLWWKSYSFEPKFQDAVVYAWLSDSQAWESDLPTLLRQGQIERVLRLLSGTWTSLGYGIESNSMSSYLPQIYQKMLLEELRKWE